MEATKVEYRTRGIVSASPIGQKTVEEIQADPPNEITCICQKLEGRLVDLHNRIDRLNTRLDSVLSDTLPLEPDSNNVVRAGHGASCVHGRMLSNFIDATESANNKLDFILSRLAL